MLSSTVLNNLHSIEGIPDSTEHWMLNTVYWILNKALNVEYKALNIE